MKKKNTKNIKCKHSFEIIDKNYDYFNQLTKVIIFCSKCGLIIKKEII